jgi:hypothetical protein
MKVVSRAFRPHSALFTVLGLIGLGSLACTGSVDDGGPHAQTGGTTGNAGSGPGAGTGGVVPYNPMTGGPKLRVLTQAEYKSSLSHLLGAISAPLKLPDDFFTPGFTSIGGAQVVINAPAVELYEAASRAAAAEVFADAARWQQLVGCQPQADLSDACVSTFIQTFGKRAFRRVLEATELEAWLKIGKDAAALPGSSAAKGLETVVSGFLQSPFFLYRVETNRIDTAMGRLKYDGGSMATRLAFLLTGRTPDDALLSAAASGQLDTAEGVRTAATPLLNDPSAADRMAVFFDEFSQARFVHDVEKSPTLFPSWNPALKTSMEEATRLFIKKVVLAPGADVRSFFDSNQTFVDANLAPIYGVAVPASGFAQITLGPETGRAGIFGQAAVLAGHSQADHNSPTRRGVFIASTFLCSKPPDPPPGIPTSLTPDPTKTERQILDAHRTQETCKSCHALFDPLGFGLEHFDSIGKYRDMENGQPIDATGSLDGVPFDGAAQMGTVLRGNARILNCMMDNFYRASNGVPDSAADSAQVESLAQVLATKGYVWRDFLLDFVVSDAFRSAPVPAVTAGNQ